MQTCLQILRCGIGGSKGKCLCNFVRYCCPDVRSIFMLYFLSDQISALFNSQALVIFFVHLCCGWIYHRHSVNGQINLCSWWFQLLFLAAFHFLYWGGVFFLHPYYWTLNVVCENLQFPECTATRGLFASAPACGTFLVEFPLPQIYWNTYCLNYYSGHFLVL